MLRKSASSFVGRAVAVLAALFALFFVMHSRLDALPNSSHELTHHFSDRDERRHPPGDHKATSERAEHPAKKEHLKEHPKREAEREQNSKSAKSKHAKSKRSEPVSAVFTGGKVTLHHYGHGIVHVQYESNDAADKRSECRFHEHSVVAEQQPFDSVDTTHGIAATAEDVAVDVQEVDNGVTVSAGNVQMRIPFKGAPEVVQHKAGAATGLAERTSGLLLTSRKYELWNVDVQYTLGNAEPMYGVVPLVVGIGNEQGDSSGVLWLNPSHTTVTMTVGDDSVTSQWQAKKGCAQFVVYPGGSTMDVLRQHAHTTGMPFFPPQFTLGYHQCRWSYKTQHDVEELNDLFEEHQMPCDVVWLDIDHADRKHYFNFLHKTFPNPQAMQKKLADKGRRLVAINDPHISADPGYSVYSEGTKHGYFVKEHHGKKDFHGHCWPGDSTWVDFLNPKAREWYSGLFAFDKFQDSSDRMFTWIDMNEPSVFSGPRLTLPDNVEHYDQTQHVEVHNMYGHLHAMATFEAHQKRSEGKERGFVLSRSFFAGTQRYAAVWTGDNQAQWEYLSASVYMLLALSMEGIPFVGADVGGFFAQRQDGTTDDELIARWFQVGSMYPFFRGHAHEASVRKEPYLVKDKYRGIIRTAIVRRYSLLPYLYTTFWNASTEGVPVWRPLFLQFPKERASRVSAFMVGEHLLYAPIVSQSAKQMTLTFPGEKSLQWYDYETHKPHAGGSDLAVTVTPQTDLLYQMSGSVVVTKLMSKEVRSTEEMDSLCYELRIAVDENGCAEGFLYLDDGHSTEYQRGYYNFKRVHITNKVLKIECGHSAVTSKYSRMPPHDVEYTPKGATISSIILLGWKDALPKTLKHDTLAHDAVHITGLEYPIHGGWDLDLSASRLLENAGEGSNVL